LSSIWEERSEKVLEIERDSKAFSQYKVWLWCFHQFFAASRHREHVHCQNEFGTHMAMLTRRQAVDYWKKKGW